MSASRLASALPPEPDAPLGLAEFSAALDALGPFERQPHLAVAVSGGRDSLALAVLSAQWASRRDGKITALIVDHGLRGESAAEAAHVCRLLAARGIAAQILAWQGDKPTTGIAEAARDARYRLLQDWCARAGVLHLLLAHQRDDQAETLLMRLGEGSMLDGLAAMAPVRELDRVRLLRPLLDVPRSRLTATLRSCGIDWVDDPSNGNLRYLRPCLRRGLTPEVAAHAAALSARLAADRGAIERRLATIAAQQVTMHETGWATVVGLADLPEQIALRLLSMLVGTLGGGRYRPRRAGLLQALADLRAGRATVAGGCIVAPQRGGHVVARECGAIGHVIGLEPVGGARRLRWDNRFELALDAELHGTVAALGEAGRLAVRRQERFAGPLRQAVAELPPAAARALPALWRPGKAGSAADLLAVGHGGRLGGGPATVGDARSGRLAAVFRPGRPLAAAPHALVLAGQHLI